MGQSAAKPRTGPSRMRKVLFYPGEGSETKQAWTDFLTVRSLNEESLDLFATVTCSEK